MNVSQVGNTKPRAALNSEGEFTLTEEILEKEEEGEPELDCEKYLYLSEARGYSIEDLKNDKEDSFMNSTKAQATIINYLGMFNGMFTRRSLETYYYEGLFILEQEYEDLRKTLMINEVLFLALTLIENELFPSDMFMPNVYNILTKGVIDILNGKEKVVYKDKLLLRFTKAISLSLEKEKLNTIESVDWYKKFTKKLVENFGTISKPLKNHFIANYVDFVWFGCSDFNFYLGRKDRADDGNIYDKEWLAHNGSDLEFFLNQIEPDEVESYKELATKVQRLMYIGIELLSESWDEDEVLSPQDKKMVCGYFEVVYICMKNKYTCNVSFDEVKDQCKEGAFTVFDRFFMMLTKQSHPMMLEQDFGDLLTRCVEHWKTIFKSQIDDEEFLDLKLGVLIQLNMILYQIIKSFDLANLTHYVVDFLVLLTQASIDLIGSLKNIQKKKDFTKDIRVSFDQILTKINFGRVPKRFEEKMAKVNALIVIFLGKIDNLGKTPNQIQRRHYN